MSVNSEPDPDLLPYFGNIMQFTYPQPQDRVLGPQCCRMQNV